MKGLSIAGRKRASEFDHYATPEWATKALLEREKFRKEIYNKAIDEAIEQIKVMSKVVKEPPQVNHLLETVITSTLDQVTMRLSILKK